MDLPAVPFSTNSISFTGAAWGNIVQEAKGSKQHALKWGKEEKVKLVAKAQSKAVANVLLELRYILLQTFVHLVTSHLLKVLWWLQTCKQIRFIKREIIIQ